ncbi:heme ABC transporter ATP-binding protein [Shewanella sp. Scap07]|uniref:heme ABC transporter ATP-binding protein n=1 Tax=Shewanella sp. Scap07 TaxID=2589987 RepID=UPI0015C10301|nr:heme ABC transporter ATP-binding protein [Shewanella sp. Scap07]QLE86678.1 heme ABC transporter ATP-binding protein [Shewanella sp. Scap07]
MTNQTSPNVEPSGKTVLQVNKLSVRIGQKTVLSHIDLNIQAGQVTALLGPNGAGKSTLLKSLCQEVAADNGTIDVFGAKLEQWDRQQLAKSMAVLPQHASLTFPFKVHEVVEMGLYPLSLSQQQGKQLVLSQLEQVDLLHLKDRSYPTLSGGEKQRVQLARVLTQLAQAPQSPILLLDEPTSALDLAQQHRVLSLAKRLAHEQGYAVIVVLHDLNQASRYADRLVILEQGQVVEDGSPEQTLTPATIRQVWHYDPVVVNQPNSATPLLF